MAKQKILVTGGSGFIGSHLCDFLIEKGNSVVCVDNLFTGTKKNVEHLMDSDSFEFIEHDIIEPMEIKVDQIYNLACPASPIHYQENPVKTVKTSVMGMINMLDLAQSSNVRILQASTSEVYGDPEVHPQPETYNGNVNPLGPRACYDEGKRVAETLMMDYHRENQVDVRIARIFNTYGPRMAQDDGRVVSNFITQALTGKDLTIYGDGKQTRSFCYVSDMVIGLYEMMNQNNIGPINLGNPHEITVGDLATEIIELSDSISQVIFKKLPEDDPKQRKPDISLAREVLGWDPQVSLKEGMSLTVKYFKEVLGK
ncbi:MAG: NAD-dependent dehydratase [Euryarchaeota archaeon]|jgi:UDP-glucuronate decarboxylase|nr:NAD-dependent dehydratase [Euryarchaeota archaeon]|tara:strand:+ start:53694 stop:54632 length:939 start_codon:yes stop_codon:yes gene_type:complete